ncbi:MAG: hypothetical protein RIS08_639 [Actinomycetota bacterium]|jgi:ATP-binding cassette subfamily C protein CydD
MKPIDPRLFSASKTTSWLIASLVVLALAGVATTTAIAHQLATFVVAVFIQAQPLESALPGLALVLILGGVRAVIHFCQESLASIASLRIKHDLREKSVASLISQPGVNSGEWSYLLGPGLDSLDVYFAKYLPQLVFTALVTPIFVVLLFLVDPTSGFVLVFTLPLIPVFMVLIGRVTKEAQDRQLQSLTRLNQHFLEVLRGLNTLRIFNRVERQAEILSDLSLQHRSKTMRVLRISFLSGFALELAASLSVALMAVTIGVRLIDGELSLYTGLFILLIAPEAYLPLRQVGAQFHAAQEAVSVSTRVLDQMALEKPAVGALIEISSGITAFVGPSGSGKSSMLRSISNRGGYQPQTPMFVRGSIQDNILMGAEFNEERFLWAKRLARIGDLEDSYLLSETSSLSGGQLQRVNLARALYRADQGSKLLILDEPLSQLDPLLVREIANDLSTLSREGFRLVIATHQRELMSMADREVRLG